MPGPAAGTRTSRLDWPTLLAAFEVAALLRCGAGPTARLPLPYVGPVPARRGPALVTDEQIAEFNQRPAAERLVQLLTVLEIPARSVATTGGLRRRYDLHRVHVPGPAAARLAGIGELAWRQGRDLLLGPGPTGVTAARHRRRPVLAAAAWRAALLAAGRHVRRHVLGVHVNDHDVAAVLVRGAHLLDAAATLRGRRGCFLVSVAVGPDRERILRGTELPVPADRAA
ncbi:hypothetical protein AB0J86_16855 [Micromonospora sp. NPDC049559]|uniref:hypothetical protein n=1 Tax=Micromonospora sp. NPDC049559 TaxID=3155923 RepID=UPI003437C91B